MEINKLDSFFKDKLIGYGVVPGDDAFALIEAELKPKQKRPWIKLAGVAAAVLITCAVVLVSLDNSTSVEPMASSDISIIEEAPVLPKKPIDEEVILPKVNMTVAAKVVQSAVEPLVSEVPAVQLAMLNLEKKSYHQEMGTALSQPNFELFGTKAEPKISIKYVADATETPADASKGKLGKFISYARSTSPAEVMAQLRDAKDNFIDSRLNLD